VFYIYDNEGFFTGKTSEKQVPNSFEWKPNQASKGHRIWFNGFCWEEVKDYKSEVWSFEEAKQIALEYLYNKRFVSDPDGKYSSYEQDTFDAQFEEAKVVKAGGKAGPYLTAISSQVGESVEVIAQKVLDKRADYDARLSVFVAKLQRLRNQIAKAKTKSELPKLSYMLKSTV